jgi:nicotinate-nucleotide--dimethylbenzimidazole phosphoribosyltransferase
LEVFVFIPIIPGYDVAAASKAQDRQNQLTKPAGSLGQLEALAVRLAGITGNPRPRFKNKGVIVMAGDHGVALEGVSAYPPGVTPQMVLNFLHGGAAINVLARQAGARVVIVDIGVAHDFGVVPGLVARKVAWGTSNLLNGPAMRRDQAEQAIQVGVDLVSEEIANGLDLVATGDMGIGNTTPSAAITAVLTGRPVAEVTGRGTGIDDQQLQRKVAVIEHSITLNAVNAQDPLDVLSKVGGLEIAGLVGVILGAAAKRVPVVVDGFISGAAALVAYRLAPGVKPFLIASHQSVEVGHKAIWDQLDQTPLLNLNLRLGEGSGAVLAFHLIEAATRILDEMATFSDAGVSNKE